MIAAGCGLLGQATCHTTELEWDDFLVINHITYSQNHDGTRPVTAEQLGERVGETSYMLNNHACAGHVSKNGDAAFLPVGTPVYSLQGYESDYRVAADNKVYEVTDNPNAATFGQLLDIEGKVRIVSLESEIDGSPIGDFSPEASSAFVRALLTLPYVGFDAVYEKIKHDNGIYLRLHLRDGTSFRMVFYPQGNAFANGAFGTDELKSLILSQRQHIKAAAGL